MNELDYTSLETAISGKKTIKLADVKDRIQKVAFDVVRFTDSGNFDKLWIVKEENGEKVLVAMYDEEEPLTVKASAWVAMTDSFDNINVFYKGEAIAKFAVSKMGIAKEDASTVCRSLPEKLASDNSYVSSMLSAVLNYNERTDVYSKYPELKGSK